MNSLPSSSSEEHLGDTQSEWYRISRTASMGLRSLHGPDHRSLLRGRSPVTTNDLASFLARIVACAAYGHADDQRGIVVSHVEFRIRFPTRLHKPFELAHNGDRFERRRSRTTVRTVVAGDLLLRNRSFDGVVQPARLMTVGRLMTFGCLVMVCYRLIA